MLSPDERRQRQEFVEQIKEHGYQEAIEEVAYTWFNRFAALRFMGGQRLSAESCPGVFSDANGSFSPEIPETYCTRPARTGQGKSVRTPNANQTE